MHENVPVNSVVFFFPVYVICYAFMFKSHDHVHCQTVYRLFIRIDKYNLHKMRKQQKSMRHRKINAHENRCIFYH